MLIIFLQQLVTTSDVPRTRTIIKTKKTKIIFDV